MNTATIQVSEEAKLFSRLTISTIVLLVLCAAISIALWVGFGSPVARIITLVVTLLLLPISLASLRLLRKNRLQLAVLLSLAIWYVLALAMILVGERLYSIMLVCSIMPVMMAMPFVLPRVLQKIIGITMLFIVIGSITANFPPFITPTVPDDLMFYVDSGMSSLLAVVVMLSMWQSGGRLAAAAVGMREAIVGLKESESLLETKVEERTEELEQAFREISDINEIARVVNSTLDVDKVIDTIYNETQKLFSFDQMGVFQISEEDNRLHMTQQAGQFLGRELEDLLVHDGLALDATDTTIAYSVVNQKTLYRTGVTERAVKLSGPGDQQIYQIRQMKSFLLCPLSIEGKAIGCIFFNASDEAFDLSEAEIDSIVRYVTQLGTAIRNAQLFRLAEESRHEAETASQTKGTFLANMSHEIRTPMNAIVGLTGLCLDTPLDSKQKDYLTKVSNAANSLTTIIDDILDFSKLESGKLEFENIPFSLNDVLDNLATICMVRCQSKRLELIFDRDPLLPDTLQGDPTRLGQILINLAGNAIKFTEQGQIVVEVRQVSRSDGQVNVHFDVRDSGIGMNEKQLGRLFQSFSQADSTISRQYGGTGLGLAISQQLTQTMGGEIEVSSAPGEGSSFHFTLEFDIAETAPASPERDEAPQNLKVLVVDDNEATRVILREYLHSFGYEVTLATSGEEALELLSPGHNFDLVLLDWMMPGMTGLDVALAIHQMETSPKIILLSSWTLPSSEHLDRVDAFLAKPINPSSLLDTIMQVYGIEITKRRLPLKSATAPEDLAPIRGARVLVVDDSDINLQIASELLNKIPMTLDTASEGEEAIRKIKSNTYEAVLMDIQMPGIDGYAATRIIREEYGAEHLPIIAMTANVMAEDKARAKEAGMNGHVAKPVDPSELFEALLEVIDAGDYSAYLPTAVPPPMNLEIDTAAISLANYPGLDTKQGLSRLAGNEKLYRKLLEELFTEYEGAASALTASLEQGQPEEARAIAHKLRGIANNLGAFSVGSCAEHIEKSILSGHEVTLDNINQLSAALEEAAESARNLIAVRSEHEASGSSSSTDVQQLLSRLRQAIETSDPTAVDIVDEFLPACASNDEAKQLLIRSRASLDNFDFAAAEPLLAELEKVV